MSSKAAHCVRVKLRDGDDYRRVRLDEYGLDWNTVRGRSCRQKDPVLYILRIDLSVVSGGQVMDINPKSPIQTAVIQPAI